LVAASEAERFLDAWRTAYVETFPGAAMKSEFFISSAGPGLKKL